MAEFFKSKFVRIALVIICIYLVYSNLKIVFFNVKYTYQIFMSKRQLVRVERNRNQLLADLEKSELDSEIEKLARYKLGLIKNGEVAYQIIKKGD